MATPVSLAVFPWISEFAWMPLFTAKLVPPILRVGGEILPTEVP